MMAKEKVTTLSCSKTCKGVHRRSVMSGIGTGNIRVLLLLRESKRGTYLLHAETKHIWLELCAEAAICEDATRLKQLESQIVAILRVEQKRAANKPPDSSLRNSTAA